MVVNQLFLSSLPAPIILLDQNLCIQSCSKTFQENFKHIKITQGAKMSSLFGDLPHWFFYDLENCLNTGVRIERTAKSYLENGRLQWFKWTITTTKAEVEIENLELCVCLENITVAKIKEELYRTSEQVAKIGSWELDLLRGQIYWSDVTKDIHEVPEDFVPNLEKGVNYYKEGYDRDTIKACVNKAIKDGTPWDKELQIITHTGKTKWVNAKGYASLVEGKCVRLYGTFQDIDIRKKEEIAFKKTTERLVMVTSTSGIGVWEIDLIEGEIYGDEIIYDILGCKEEINSNALLTYFIKGISKKDFKFLLHAIENATPKTNKFNLEFEFKNSNKHTKWLKAIITLVYDEFGKPSKIVGVFEDVSALHKTKLKLETIKKGVEKTFTNSTVGMALLRVNCKVKEINSAFCKSILCTKQDMVDQHITTLIVEEDQTEVLEAFNDCIARGQESFQLQVRFFNALGEIVDTIFNATAHRNYDGVIHQFMVQIVDISSLKKAKQKLKFLLGVSNKQNESLLNFAHIVSHNLRSHSANLTMITGMMLENKAILNEEQIQTLKMLSHASKGLNETIVHLNEVVQIKFNTSENLKPISLAKQLKRVVNNISALVDNKEVELKLDYNTSLKVYAVAAYLESILQNLITNAIKYRDNTKNCYVKVFATSTRDKVKIIVQDNGLGINLEKHRDKLFGMYKTFHKHPEARGIGLFMTKNQIEAMGGVVSVESKLGCGSIFTVELDRA